MDAITPKEVTVKKSGRILVADDEIGLRRLLSRELSRLGYEVKLAESGLEALETLNNEPIDLVLCDINMPGIDGLELIKRARAASIESEFIVMTGFGTVDAAVTAMKNGASDFVQKPFDLDLVFSLIDKALEKQELRVLAGIYQASRLLLQNTSLDVLLRETTTVAKAILKADGVCIFNVDETATLNCGGSETTKNSFCVEFKKLADYAAADVRRWGNGATVIRPCEDPRFQSNPVFAKVQSALLFPLLVDKDLVAVLVACRNRDQQFGEIEKRSATIFASLLSQAIRNAKLFGRLEKRNADLAAANARIEETQAQLLQTEKLASIGQLAAGVAHELNNPLSGVLGFAQLLLDDPTLTAQQRDDLKTIHDQSLRCKTIIQDLLQFSRKREQAVEDVNWEPLVAATLDLLQYDLRTSGVDLACDIPSDLPCVRADSQQLQQVLLNIIKNAQQALEPRGGHITISGYTEGNEVVISIKDDGPGIPMEIQGKIFDPFFTTKPPGKGTGLGLSICYGIIKRNNGALEIKSQPGQGAEFVIRLPEVRP